MQQKSPKINIRLIASPWMDSRRSQGEHSRIRIPKRARSVFQVSQGSTVVLRSPVGEFALEVGFASQVDVVALLESLQSGEISSGQADVTAFVTSKTRTAIVGQIKGAANLYFSSDIDNLKIGADPEFCLVDPSTGRFKYAQQIPDLTISGELGQDGPLAELRPPPKTDVGAFVDSIREILKQNAKLINNYEWWSGATYKSKTHPSDRVLSIGGHIHIGDPPLLPPEAKQEVYRKVIQILDETVATPLVRVDAPHQELRRGGKEGYGRWGDQRPQAGRFEWRVPSGFWLAHPILARAVLGTTKAVSEACYQRMASNKYDTDYIEAPLNKRGFLRDWGALAKDKVAKLLNESDADKIDNDYTQRAADKLKSLENYNQYREEIDAFADIITMSKKDRERINLNMRSTWLEDKQLIAK